eukprot:2078166-Rhodomonas_salina.1
MAWSAGSVSSSTQSAYLLAGIATTGLPTGSCILRSVAWDRRYAVSSYVSRAATTTGPSSALSRIPPGKLSSLCAFLSSHSMSTSGSWLPRRQRKYPAAQNERISAGSSAPLYRA